MLNEKIMKYSKLRVKLVSEDDIAVSKLDVLDNVVSDIVNKNNDRNNI